MNNLQLNLDTFNELKTLLEDEFAEFLTIFMEDAEIELNNIKQGIQQNDYAQVSSAAHKLKSSAAYIGAVQLQELSSQLEAQSKEVTIDNIDDVYNQANHAFVELKNQLGS